MIEVVDLDTFEKSPCSRYGHSTIVVKDRLYLFGGGDPTGTKSFNDLHTFDLEKMEWGGFSLSPEEIPGRHFHSCSYDEKNERLVFFGGKANKYLNDVFTFDLRRKEFHLIEPKFVDKENILSCVNDHVRPPSARYGHSCCYHSSKMFIFGGYDTNGFTRNDLYRFDFKTFHWKKLIISQIPFRYHHSGILLKNNYFIIGGMTKRYESLDDLWRIDLKTIEKEEEEGEEEEEEEEDMIEAFQMTIENPVRSYGHKCFVINDKIFMYGGRSEERGGSGDTVEHKTVMSLESSSGGLRWEEVADFPFNSNKMQFSHLSIDVFNHKILFFGGQKREDKRSSKSHTKKKEEKKKIEKDNNKLMIGQDLSYDEIFVILSFIIRTDALVNYPTIRRLRTLLKICFVSKSWSISLASRSEKIWGRYYRETTRGQRMGFDKIPKIRMKKVQRMKTSFEKFRMFKVQLHHHRIFQRKEGERMRKLEEKDLKRRNRELKENHKLFLGHDFDIFNKNVFGDKSLRTINLKTVFIGDGAVGKTSLCYRLGQNIFPADDIGYCPTVFDNYNASVLSQNRHFSIGIWDTAGEEDYDALRPLSYPETNVFVICFSLICPTSYQNVRTKWNPEIRGCSFVKDYGVILCGTKLDLREDSQVMRELQKRDEKPVTVQEGEKLAREIFADCYIETSAKTGKGAGREFFDLVVFADLIGKHRDELNQKENDSKCGVM